MAIQYYINEAECVVLRPGTQAKLIKDKHRDMVDRPEARIHLEAIPGFTDPEGPHGGEWLHIHLEWMDRDRCSWGTIVYMHIDELGFLKRMRIGDICYSDSAESNVEYRFSLMASYALTLLIKHDKIPANSLLMNEDDVPINDYTD